MMTFDATDEKLFQKIGGKEDNASNTAFSTFPTMFPTLWKTNLMLGFRFYLLSANAFNLVGAQILSFGKRLISSTKGKIFTWENICIVLYFHSHIHKYIDNHHSICLLVDVKLPYRNNHLKKKKNSWINPLPSNLVYRPWLLAFLSFLTSFKSLKRHFYIIPITFTGNLSSKYWLSVFFFFFPPTMILNTFLIWMFCHGKDGKRVSLGTALLSPYLVLVEP